MILLFLRGMVMEALSRKKAFCARIVSAALTGSCLMFVASFARADLTTNVFTTQQDFTGWTSGDFILAPAASPDFDASSTNGLGNTTAPGGTGTPGSLSVTWISGTFTFGFSPQETTNTALIAALGTGGLIKYQFSTPDNEAPSGGYFAIGMALNYDGHFFGGAWYDGGTPPQYAIPAQYAPVTNEFSGDVTAYARYTFVPSAVATYLQWGFFFNSNYSPVNPFAIDAIQIVRPTGDFNFDGHVDAQDIAVMESALANPSAYESQHNLVAANLIGLGDFNGDGKFNNADLQKFLASLIAGNGNTSVVPEPASLVLLGMAVPALIAAARLRRKV
jgi:hypothetical protein